MRLDTNYREKSVKNTSTWRLNNTFINNKQVTEWNQKGNKKFLETNDNENMITQNLWDAAKAVLTGKFIAIQSYLRLTISSWDSFSSLYLSRNMCISFSDGLIHNYVPYSLTFLFILIISVAMAPLSFLFVGIWVYSLFFFKFLHFKCL